jgi:hypothetical protein
MTAAAGRGITKVAVAASTAVFIAVAAQPCFVLGGGEAAGHSVGLHSAISERSTASLVTAAS